MFVKREVKVTLVENFVEALIVEEDLLSIGAHEHDTREDSKVVDKKTQSFSSKSHNKDSFDS